MKYIGKKFAHFYFQDENHDIYEISASSDEVFYCCNKQGGPHNYEDDFYSTKHSVDTLEKIDLVELRVYYLLKNEKVTFDPAGTLNGNKYFIDNFNNVYGYNKDRPKEVHLCGLRRSRDFRLDDLKKSNCLDFKRKLTNMSSSDLQPKEKPKKKRSKKSSDFNYKDTPRFTKNDDKDQPDNK